MGESPARAIRPDPEGITAVILAGGRGLRLRSAVPDRQKVLAPVCGKPFLTFLLDELQVFGTKRVVLCAGYLARDLAETFEGPYGRMNIEVSCEPSALGTAGALRRAMPLVNSGHVLVMNGDSYCTTGFADFFDAHFQHRADASLMLARVEDAGPYGSVKVGPDGRVLKFDEKIGDSGPAWINAGVYLIRKELIKDIPADRPVSIERDVFPAWTAKRFFGFKGDGKLLDIGTPERYAAANAYFASRTDAGQGEMSYGHQ